MCIALEEGGFEPVARQMQRERLAKSLSRSPKLWTIKPSSVRLLPHLAVVEVEGLAGSTGLFRWASANLGSPSPYSRGAKSRRRCPSV